MADIYMKVEGVPELLKNLKSWQAIKREACSDALKRGGFKVETLAKQLCAVDTGRLRASISVNWAGSGMDEGKVDSKAQAGDGIKEPGGQKGLVVVTGTNVIYAPFVEYGTVKMPGRPYLYAAYFSYEGEIIMDIERILSKDERLK